MGAPTLDELLPPRRTGASQIPNENAVPTLDDLMNAEKGRLAASAPAPTQAKMAPVTDDDFAGSTLQFGPWDTHIPIPASVGKGLAQLGSGMADLPLRGRQLVGAAGTSDVDEKRALDARLNAGFTGTLNSIAGQALPYAALPEVGLPKALGAAAPVIKSALTGALQGYMQPVGTGDNSAFNTAVGAGAGLAIPGIVETVRGIGTAGSSAMKDLAKTAITQYGIPLGAADVSQNKFVKAFGSLMNDTGFNSGRIADKKAAYQKAISNAIGENADSLTPDVIEQAKTRVGNDLDSVWNQNVLPYTQSLDTKLDAVQAAADRYPGATADTVRAHIAELRGRMQPNPTTGAAEIPGDIANNYQSNLYKNHNGMTNPQLDNQMLGIRKAIIDEFNANVSPQTAALNDQARGQWRAIKALEPAVTKSENAVAGRLPGDVSPVDLSAAVQHTYGMNPSPFGDLPKIGQYFLRDNANQTGGSARAFLQNLGIVGLGGTGLASGIGTGVSTGVLPAAAATSGALALGGFAANKAAQSPALYKLMAGIGDDATPGIVNAMKQLAKNEVARLPSAGALALLESGVARKNAQDELEQSAPSDDTTSPEPVQGALGQTAPETEPTQ